MRAERFNTILLATTMSLALASATVGAEIKGTVRETSTGTATLAIEGELLPAVGDKAEIYFKLAGSEDEISVAAGSVIKVEADSIQLKIENATGDVVKDQLVRIASANPQKRSASAVTPSPGPGVSATGESSGRASAQSSPSSPVAPGSPLLGRWRREATAAQPDIDPAVMELIEKGASQYSAGNFDGAIASYTSAIRSAPRLGVAYLNRGNAYLYKSNFRAALADANQAIDLTVPKMEDVYTVRGTAKSGLGDWDGAIADCNRALEIDPKNALAYNNRANNKLRKADYKGALADCNKTISLNSNSALGYYNRGFARTNLGDQAGALEDWQKAVALQASFGAELNPKIAQLQALGIRPPRDASTPTNAPGAAEWTDLTNAAQKLVGSWKGGRHVTQYLADGSFYTDPHLVPNPPRGQWRIEGRSAYPRLPAGEYNHHRADPFHRQHVARRSRQRRHELQPPPRFQMNPYHILSRFFLCSLPIMAITATAHAQPSPTPEKWEVSHQLIYGLPWWGAKSSSEAELVADVKDAESTPDQRLVSVLNNLAGWYRERKKFTEAEKIYQRVLELQEDRMGRHYDVALTHNDLGVLYTEAGQFEKAEPHFKQALEMWRTLWDRDYRGEDEAVAMHNYAVLLEKTGRAAEAKEMEAKAVAIMEAKRKMLGG